MDFGEALNDLSLKLPEGEKYNLSSQIRRAADSIALNIAEGSIGQSDAEFARFLGYSIRSLAEVVTCSHKMIRRGFIDKKLFDELYGEAFNIMNMLIAFRRNIKCWKATADFRLRTSDSRLPTSVFGLPTSDFGPRSSDFRLNKTNQ